MLRPNPAIRAVAPTPFAVLAQAPNKSAGYLGKRLLGRKRAPAKDPSDKTCCVVESVVALQDDSSFVSHIADPVLRKLAEADRSLSGKSRIRRDWFRGTTRITPPDRWQGADRGIS
jgi:hypothetical protein